MRPRPSKRGRAALSQCLSAHSGTCVADCTASCLWTDAMPEVAAEMCTQELRRHFGSSCVYASICKVAAHSQKNRVARQSQLRQRRFRAGNGPVHGDCVRSVAIASCQRHRQLRQHQDVGSRSAQAILAQGSGARRKCPPSGSGNRENRRLAPRRGDEEAGRDASAQIDEIPTMVSKSSCTPTGRRKCNGRRPKLATGGEWRRSWRAGPARRAQASGGGQPTGELHRQVSNMVMRPEIYASGWIHNWCMQDARRRCRGLSRWVSTQGSPGRRPLQTLT